MFVRVKTAYNRDGSPRNYLQIVENRRVEGKVRQKVLCNLGRLEELQNGELDGLIRSLAKFSKNLSVVSAAEELFAEWSKEYGPALVFRRLWEKLGLHSLLDKLLSSTNIAINVEEAIFCMVLNRLSDPGSKRATNEWKNEVYRPSFDSLQLQHFYRSLDFLAEHKNAIEETMFASQTDLFNRQLDLVFFDTTSTYLEGEAATGLAAYGYSKDHRPDRLQVMIGILMTRDGTPVAHQVFAGNTPDGEAFRQAVLEVKNRFNVGRIIVVGDRGMMGKKTIELLEQLKLQYILGVRMRKAKEVRDVLSRAGKYAMVKENLKVKQVIHDDVRYIVCLNEDEAKRDREVREAIVKKLEESLEKKGLKGLVGNTAYRKFLKVEGAKASIDTKQLEAEAAYDGKYVLRTNTELNAKEVALAYKDLWQIERAFRELKTTLELRPVYHWNEQRIRGHICVCFLALVLQITLQKLLQEHNSKGSYLEVLRDLKRLHVVKLKVKEEEYIVRTELQGYANEAFKAVGLKVPSRVESLK